MKQNGKKNNSRRYRVNERIKVRQVRVVSPEGEQLGILDRDEALNRAKELRLDLIEVAPTAKPPVCKIADFGKMQYEQSKREKQQRKNQNKITKTVQLKPNIGENDLTRKISDIQKFLDKGFRVVVQVTMKGRQKRYLQLAMDQTITKVKEKLEGAIMESPQQQGGRITATFTKAVDPVQS